MGSPNEWKANTFRGRPNWRYLIGHGTRRVEVITDTTGLAFFELYRCPESQRIEGCGATKRFVDCASHWTVLATPETDAPFDCAPQVIDCESDTPAPSTIDACDPIYL